MRRTEQQYLLMQRTRFHLVLIEFAQVQQRDTAKTQRHNVQHPSSKVNVILILLHNAHKRISHIAYLYYFIFKKCLLFRFIHSITSYLLLYYFIVRCTSAHVAQPFLPFIVKPKISFLFTVTVITMLLIVVSSYDVIVTLNKSPWLVG